MDSDGLRNCGVHNFEIVAFDTWTDKSVTWTKVGRWKERWIDPDWDLVLALMLIADCVSTRVDCRKNGNCISFAVFLNKLGDFAYSEIY